MDFGVAEAASYNSKCITCTLSYNYTFTVLDSSTIRFSGGYKICLVHGHMAKTAALELHAQMPDYARL